MLEVKRDIEQTKMDFYAVLIPTILSKEIFRNNNDIKALSEKLKVEKSLKDYLYDSRTALLARIIREVEANTEENLKFNISTFKKVTLDLLEYKGLVHTNEVTQIINRFSRNNKENKDG
ncbi:hypothetical protein PQ456_11475 [Paenibacillus kyungheensis]|uniref:Uncharacterized protein n=1 Tax=Paenibacillus kyungheensis TaxID=1452732 RepID=A0AAX3LWK6_9BACL|nr:hypothetical protein [Paenibacillus kyungheensis]WCT53834.1 hypothetical protein PQ456_11475 [Paenibacillus kyungheensis]